MYNNSKKYRHIDKICKSSGGPALTKRKRITSNRTRICTSLKAPTIGDNGKCREAAASVIDTIVRNQAEEPEESGWFLLLSENRPDIIDGCKLGLTQVEYGTLTTHTGCAPEVFKVISDSCQELVGVDNFMIFPVSRNKKYVYNAYVAEKNRNRPKELFLDYGEGLIGQCIKTREPIPLQDTHNENVTTLGVMEPFASHIVVPFSVEDECVGAFTFSRAPENAWNQHNAALKSLNEIISSAANSALHKKREFVQELVKRIKKESKKTEILLNIEKNLQKERNWEKGLRIIGESMNTLGFERYGIFLVKPVSKKLEFHSGKGIDLPVKGTSIPLRYSGHCGVKCVLEKKLVHENSGSAKENQLAKGNQLFHAEFVWVPIVVQNEAFAAIAAGNVKRAVSDEDVKNLEILAGMCAAFIDRTKPVVEPVAEEQLKTNPKYWLDPAEAYTVLEKNPEKSLEIFYDLVTHGIPGCVVSRVHPERIRRKHTLVKTPMLWLSQSGIEDSISSDDLFKLEYIIGDFTRKSVESVILLDGLEYLITQTTFENVLRYVQGLKDIVIINNSRLIISLHKDILSPREYSFLEREVTIL